MGFRSGITVICLMLSCVATEVRAGPWGVAQLMEALAARHSGRAEFVERKYVSILTEPVESSGELTFVKPDRLEKRTVRPVSERLVLEGDRLSLERGGERRSAGLDEYPEIAALVGSIRSTLLGDRIALEKLYRLSLNGDAGRWTLLLVPSIPAVAERVAYLRIGGFDGKVDRVEIHLPGGDYSVMSIREIAQR